MIMVFDLKYLFSCLFLSQTVLNSLLVTNVLKTHVSTMLELRENDELATCLNWLSLLCTSIQGYGVVNSWWVLSI